MQAALDANGIRSATLDDQCRWIDGTGLGELIWSLPDPPRCWLVVVPESNYTESLKL